MPITTVAQCKAFRGIEADNQEHDAELARLIDSVQAFLEEDCARRFEAATVTEYYDGDEWRDTLLLARPPITSITNLWDDPTLGFATPLDASRYAVDDKTGVVQLLDGLTFNRGIRNLKVTYVGGYSTIPADLEQAAIEMVWAAREKGVNNLIGVRSRSVADGNVQWVNLDWGSVNLQPVLSKYRLGTGLG